MRWRSGVLEAGEDAAATVSGGLLPPRRRMTPGTAEEDRSPPRSENQGFRRNYFSFFGNPLTPNSSKFEISPKFCEAFFNPVKFRQIFIKICSKTREIDSKFAKNDEIWWKNCKNKNEKLTNI